MKTISMNDGQVIQPITIPKLNVYENGSVPELQVPVLNTQTEAPIVNKEPESKCRFIKPYRFEVEKARADIEAFRSGKIKPIISGRTYLDDIFPLINGSIILIGAGSGVGKSYELATITKNVMDVNKNPDADDYVFINFSLEMKVLSLVLRGASRKTGVAKKDILFNPSLDDVQIKAVYDYLDFLAKDERMFINQDPITVDELFNDLQIFLEENKHKKTVFVSIDHLALVQSFGDMNTTIEHLTAKLNILKLAYPNVIFILLSQINGKMLERAKDGDIKSAPNEQDIYYSKSSGQIADYIMVIVNPKKLGINEYLKVSMKKYNNLENLFVSQDNKGRATLETVGVNYYHLIKCREAESGDYLDIYAEEFDFEGRDEIREKNKNKIKATSSKDIYGEEKEEKKVIMGKSVSNVFKQPELPELPPFPEVKPVNPKDAF